MFHLNLTKKKSLELLTEEVWKENISRLFANLINQISSCINELIDRLTQICFLEINSQLTHKLFKQEWEEDNPVETILNTFVDFVDHTNQMFQNKVHQRLFLKSMIQHYFNCYFEQFVWIIKNAFHKQKILQNFQPIFVNQGKEKETGRKYIKAFICNSITMRKLLQRDQQLFEDILDSIKENLTPSFIDKFQGNSQYIFLKLFDTQEPQKPFTNIQTLEEASDYLKKQIKN